MNESSRYTATNLGSLLRAQGRHQAWLARQVGISESLMSKVVLGQRTLDGSLASRISDILGIEKNFVFELRKRSDKHSYTEEIAS